MCAARKAFVKTKNIPGGVLKSNAYPLYGEKVKI
jgi:hypothetical protein